MTPVRAEPEGEVLVVTIDRPEARNAVDLAAASGIAEAMDRLDGERVLHSHSPTTRNVPNLARNAVLAVQLLRRERPSLVVSAGAGVAVPFFVAAWALGIPTVFIEVYDRVDSPTLTGRLCGPFTTRRIVQWKSQLAFYPDARLVGPLL